jgi:hypothetical protein
MNHGYGVRGNDAEWNYSVKYKCKIASQGNSEIYTVMLSIYTSTSNRQFSFIFWPCNGPQWCFFPAVVLFSSLISCREQWEEGVTLARSSQLACLATARPCQIGGSAHVCGHRCMYMSWTIVRLDHLALIRRNQGCRPEDDCTWSWRANILGMSMLPSWWASTSMMGVVMKSNPVCNQLLLS